MSSVKLNDSGDGSSPLSIEDSNATLSAKNVPIQMMIEFAKEDCIFGLSGPVKDAHFDIHAKVLPKENGKPPKLTDQQLQAMMIPLLADRFHLKVHLEPKILPIYEVVVARGGPKVTLSPGEATGRSIDMSASNNDRVLTAKSASVRDLAQVLASVVHREVIDKTGLAGRGDLTLKWTDDQALDEGGTVLSVFTAVQEQLGLKLVPSKGPVETLVIDHIGMPAED